MRLRQPSRKGAHEAGSALPATFWLLWSGTLLNRLGTLVPAFLSLYLTAQARTPPGVLGILAGCWGAGALAGALAGGALADRVGPRGTILISQLAAVVALLPLLTVRQPGALAALVLLCGVSSTLHRASGTVVVSATVRASEHVRAFGLLYWAWNIGAAVSPVVSGFLLQTSAHWLVVLNVTTALLYSAAALRLPGSAGCGRPCENDGNEPTAGRTQVWSRATEPFRSAPVAPFLLLSFCLAAIYLQKQSTLPLDMAGHGLSPRQYGLVMSLNGLLIIAALPLVARLVKRIGSSAQFLWAALLLAIGFGSNALAHTPWTYAAAILVWTAGEILLVPQASAFLVRHAPEGRVGSYQGAYFFVWNLGLVLGAPLGMAILQGWGSRALWLGCLALGLAVAAVHGVTVLRRGRCAAQRPRTR
ncbi:MFS transporter [Streptomyces sp. NPDC021093]|uniref:MFS transporter n=1 Tax=Streptomyces sp. NPDC021093 TaxID=3365112 RepID=UPI0037BDD4A1